MKHYSLLGLSIGLPLNLRVNLVTHDLHVVLANAVNLVLLKRPLNILVNALKELTLTSQKILRNIRENELVVKVSPGDLRLGDVFEVKGGYVESHVKRSLKVFDHKKPRSQSDADLVRFKLIK